MALYMNSIYKRSKKYLPKGHNIKDYEIPPRNKSLREAMKDNLETKELNENDRRNFMVSVGHRATYR